ncbi:hypothetical protein M6D81_04105 [Paenibacillus sp. J5C_2022]|uniref:hypothetical protein n=1 Tax=Paenibacillus sp. J5C2022 TaxID=2977129 RepID=UPI0021D06076|nr:hypothetical protein [Paenibacillus sp. J5C2022]MCU6707887.1 hypothetical protein [Paenibacillus sp. J5C2022]
MITSQRRKSKMSGHVARWIVIVLLSCVLIWSYYGNNAWSLEKVVSQTLAAAEQPDVRLEERISSGHGVSFVWLVDREHALMHHFFVSRPFGVLWENRSGVFGESLDNATLFNFKWHRTIIGKYMHHAYIGQANDPSISSVQLTWQDGREEKTVLKDGVFVAVRAFHKDIEEPSRHVNVQIKAYDDQGGLLYELNDDKRVVRQVEPTS